MRSTLLFVVALVATEAAAQTPHDQTAWTYRLDWPGIGCVDILRMSACGSYLDGSNQDGTRVTARRLPSTCPLVGPWSWFDDQVVIFHDDGTFTGSKGHGGQWRKVFSNQIRVDWRDLGFVDHLVLSSDGRSLSGKNQYGDRVTATRFPTIVGKWRWFDNQDVTIRADGTHVGTSGRAGSWRPASEQ